MGKRANGEGSIFQMKNLKWVADIPIEDEYGNKKRKRFMGDTQEEVIRRRDEYKKGEAQGLNMDLDKMTVDQLFSSLLETIKLTQTFGTYTRRENSYRLYIKPKIGNIAIMKLTIPQLQALFNSLSKQGFSHNTLLSVKATLRIGLELAVEQGLLTRNIATSVKLPAKKDELEKRGITSEEANRLLGLIKDHKFETPMLLMLSLGLRRGEAFGLKWADVDFNKQEVNIVGNLQRTETGEWCVQATKTRSSKAKLPLLFNLARVLKSHRAQQNLIKRGAGEHWKDNDLVFCNELGEPITAPVFSGSLKKLFAGTEFEDVTPHRFRDFCASALYAQGVDMKTIQAVLRHSSINVTMDVYTHILPGVLMDALRGMDELLAERDI